MQTQLPPAFLKRMQMLLASEYDAFLNEYEKPPRRGLRANLLKCGPEELKAAGIALRPTPFCPEGFYLEGEVGGRHPWHHAGLFYLQEPSAMCVVQALRPEPGMRVLDLCAAPGGKSTQIAARLRGEGLLWSNEIVPKRAAVLVSNLERCGVRNAVVTCETPQRLCAALSGFFDCVLVDAPCSGEGMFRREPRALQEWNESLPTACARRQMEILHAAAGAVREGGVLVYSTCTFSPEENEGVVGRFLSLRPDFEMEPAGELGRPAQPGWAGVSQQVALARRVLPQDGGEGHFVARLRRKGECPAVYGPIKGAVQPAAAQTKQLLEAFYTEQFDEPLYGEPTEHGGVVFLSPRGLPALGGLRVLRAGVPAGRAKNGRFEPEHALFLAASPGAARRVADFPLGSAQLDAFLRGEEISAPVGTAAGYLSVLAKGHCVGFGKCSGDVIKNHYPKGLRNL